MMSRLVVLVLIPLAAACSLGDVSGEGDRGGGEGGRGGDAGPAATLEIVSPSVGATFTRDSVGAFGYLVAAVPVELTIGAGIAELGYTVDGGALEGRTAAADLDVAEVRKNG